MQSFPPPDETSLLKQCDDTGEHVPARRVSTLITSPRYQVGLVGHGQERVESSDRQVPEIL